MNIEESIFKKCKFKEEDLLKYGFKKEKEVYKYSKNILSDTFRIDITIISNHIEGKIYDLEYQEEYTNFRIEDMKGPFVLNIKNEFISLLNDIKEKCSKENLFISNQTNRVVKMLKEKYQSTPNFKWEKFPSYATFNNPNTNKWYAIIMNISSTKLDKNTKGEVEVINVKSTPLEIEKLLSQEGFYEAYHMNKKHWISIILNDTVKDDVIFKLIENSYNLTSK